MNIIEAMKRALEALEYALPAKLADGTYLDKNCQMTIAATNLRNLITELEKGGWQLVPVDLPDETNLALGKKYGYPPCGWKASYRQILGMLAAAPKFGEMK